MRVVPDDPREPRRRGNLGLDDGIPLGFRCRTALQTGRAKDHARLVMFVEAGIADMDRLGGILARHSLFDAWTKFEKRFLQP